MLLGMCVAGVVLGLLGFVVSLARCRASGKAETAGGSPWMPIGTALVITLVFWGWAMKTHPPYSPGQTLGYGFLIGGILGAFALGFRAHFGIGAAAARLNAMSFLALLGASLTLLIFRSYPENALIGFAIGSVMTAIVAAVFGGERTAISVDGVCYALVSSVLSVATVMAVYRYDTVLRREWWSIPICIGMITLLSILVASEIRAGAFAKLSAAAARWLSALISAALALGITAIVAWRAIGDMRIFYAAAVGAVVFGVAAWLLDRGNDDKLVGPEKSAFAAVLVVAFFMVEFKVLAGLGLGIGLISAWSVISMLLPREASTDDETKESGISTALTGLFGFGAAILLLRLFIEQYRYDIGTRELEMHLSLIGAMIGAFLPMLLAACALRGSFGTVKLPRWMTVIQGLAAGLAAALGPIAVYMLWETRALTGMCFGLALGAGMLLALAKIESEFDAKRLLLAVLFSAGALLVACQFGDFLLKLEITKVMKFWTLGIAATALALWVVITGISAARRAQ